MILIIPKWLKKQHKRLLLMQMLRTPISSRRLLDMFMVVIELGTLLNKSIEKYFVYDSLGESTCGQRALYELGMTGIPIYNCNSNCSTGANALIWAKQLIETGQNDCVLAVGFEKMERGSLGAKVRYKLAGIVLYDLCF